MFTYQVKGTNVLFVGANEQVIVRPGQDGQLLVKWDGESHDSGSVLLLVCAATLDGLLACLEAKGLKAPELSQKVRTDLGHFMEASCQAKDGAFRAILRDHWYRLLEGIERGEVADNWWQLRRSQ